MRLGVIGYGTIVTLALQTLARELTRPLPLICVLAKAEGVERAQAMLDSIGQSLALSAFVTADLNAFLAQQPHHVAEAAGHEALQVAGEKILDAGIGLSISSVGALADQALRTALDQASQRSGAHYAPIAGAIGGLDILAAAKLSGLESVVYTGSKPPKAWKGTRAEKFAGLDELESELVFFDGSAGQAAREYPQNANVAATLALAGLGFEATRVRLIADPTITRNVHEVAVCAACANFSFRIEGHAAPDNPKTSLTVAYSLASRLLQLVHKNN